MTRPDRPPIDSLLKPELPGDTSVTSRPHLYLVGDAPVLPIERDGSNGHGPSVAETLRVEQAEKERAALAECLTKVEAAKGPSDPLFRELFDLMLEEMELFRNKQHSSPQVMLESLKSWDEEYGSTLSGEPVTLLATEVPRACYLGSGFDWREEITPGRRLSGRIGGVSLRESGKLTIVDGVFSRGGDLRDVPFDTATVGNVLGVVSEVKAPRMLFLPTITLRHPQKGEMPSLTS